MPFNFLRKKNRVEAFSSDIPQTPPEKRPEPRTFFKRRDRRKTKSRSNDITFANAIRRVGAVLSWISHGIQDLGRRATSCRTSKVHKINILPSPRTSPSLDLRKQTATLQENAGRGEPLLHSPLFTKTQIPKEMNEYNAAIGDNIPSSLPQYTAIPAMKRHEFSEDKNVQKMNLNLTPQPKSDNPPQLLMSRPEAIPSSEKQVLEARASFHYDEGTGGSEVPPEPSSEQQSRNNEVFNQIRNRPEGESNAPSDDDTTYDIDSEYSSEPDCPPNFACRERVQNRREKYGVYLPIEQIVRQTILVEYMRAVDIVLEEFDQKHQEIQERKQLCRGEVDNIVNRAIDAAQERARIPPLGSMPGDDQVLGVMLNMAFLADYRKKMFGRVMDDSDFDPF